MELIRHRLCRLIQHTFRAIGAVAFCFCSVPYVHVSAQATIAPSHVQICLKETAFVSANVVRLSNLIEERHSTAIPGELLNIVLSPSPSPSSEQLWTRETVESLLKLKGIDIRQIHWTGPKECRVQRSADISVVPASTFQNSETAVTQAVATSVPYSTSQSSLGPTSQSNSISGRNAISAIQHYLRTVSDSDFEYEIQVDIPQEGIALLRSRSSILSVSGGTPPWLGEQRFVIQTKNRNEIVNVEVNAVVEMPMRVFATNRSLAKDHIIDESDLRLIVLPKSSRVEAAVCFTNMEDLLGKQLRRTLATGQPIENSHIGNPRLVDQSDEVEVQVSAAGLMVKTNAKALQGGGMDDLIVVEVLPHRSKVTARIIGPGVVSVISN